MICLHTFVLFNVYTCNEMKGNKNISVKQLLHGGKYSRFLDSNLSTFGCAGWCTERARHREGGCEGGGGGDGGGGDPVEEEPSLPVPVNLRARLVLLHRFSFNFPLEGGRLNCSFGFHPVQGDGSPLPPCAGGNGS